MVSVTGRCGTARALCISYEQWTEMEELRMPPRQGGGRERKSMNKNLHEWGRVATQVSRTNLPVRLHAEL